MQTTMIISTEKLSYKAHVGFVEYVTKKFSATVLVTPDYVFVVTDTNVISANELWHYIREVLPEVEIMNLEQSFYICVPRTTECYGNTKRINKHLFATNIVRSDEEIQLQTDAVNKAISIHAKERQRVDIFGHTIDYAAETGSRVIDDLDKAIDRAMDSTNKAISKLAFTEDKSKEAATESMININTWGEYSRCKRATEFHVAECDCVQCEFIKRIDYLSGRDIIAMPHKPEPKEEDRIPATWRLPVELGTLSVGNYFRFSDGTGNPYGRYFKVISSKVENSKSKNILDVKFKLETNCDNRSMVHLCAPSEQMIKQIANHPTYCNCEYCKVADQ